MQWPSPSEAQRCTAPSLTRITFYTLSLTGLDYLPGRWLTFLEFQGMLSRSTVQANLPVTWTTCQRSLPHERWLFWHSATCCPICSTAAQVSWNLCFWRDAWIILWLICTQMTGWVISFHVPISNTEEESFHAQLQTNISQEGTLLQTCWHESKNQPGHHWYHLFIQAHWKISNWFHSLSIFHSVSYLFLPFFNNYLSLSLCVLDLHLYIMQCLKYLCACICVFLSLTFLQLFSSQFPGHYFLLKIQVSVNRLETILAVRIKNEYRGISWAMMCFSGYTCNIL